MKRSNEIIVLLKLKPFPQGINEFIFRNHECINYNKEPIYTDEILNMIQQKYISYNPPILKLSIKGKLWCICYNIKKWVKKQFHFIKKCILKLCSSIKINIGININKKG